ncbi:MAG: hypothetical protein ACK5LZ_06775 [Anaerorhabdus sp.]
MVVVKISNQIGAEIQVLKENLNKFSESVQSVKFLLQKIETYEASGKYWDETNRFAQQVQRYLEVEKKYYDIYIKISEEIIRLYEKKDKMAADELGWDKAYGKNNR